MTDWMYLDDRNTQPMTTPSTMKIWNKAGDKWELLGLIGSVMLDLLEWL